MSQVVTVKPQVISTTEVRQRAFLKAYAKTGNISEAAKASRIERRSHYNWKASDPDYSEAFAVAHEEAIDSLETVARKRAVHGSDVLLIFLLKGARPDKYRDQWKGELTAAVAATNLDISKLDESEIEHLRQLALKAATQSQAD